MNTTYTTSRERFVDTLIRLAPLVILSFAIAITPSIPFGYLSKGKVIEIRIEDILLTIFGLFWIIGILFSGKTKLEKPPLFLPIFFWLGIGFVSLLINLILRNLNFDWGFFYFLKQIEIFFLYFYVFYHLKSFRDIKFIIKIWIFLLFLNFLYIIYQIFFSYQVGENGTAALSEEGVFPTGAFFLLFFVFLLNVFLHYFLNSDASKIKKFVLGAFIVAPVLGVFGSASKTNFLALFLALFLTIIFLFWKKRELKIFLVGILIFLSVIGIFISALNRVNTIERIYYIFSLKNIVSNFEFGRWIVIKANIDDFVENLNLLSLMLGKGVGSVGETHNQYLRNLVETGIIGSLAFLFLIFAILKKSFQGFLKSKESLLTGLSGGLLVATLTMLFFSIATEPFLTVKPSEIFWFFAAITMAALNIDKKQTEYEFGNNNSRL